MLYSAGFLFVIIFLNKDWFVGVYPSKNLFFNDFYRNRLSSIGKSASGCSVVASTPDDSFEKIANVDTAWERTTGNINVSIGIGIDDEAPAIALDSTKILRGVDMTGFADLVVVESVCFLVFPTNV